MARARLGDVRVLATRLHALGTRERDARRAGSSRADGRDLRSRAPGRALAGVPAALPPCAVARASRDAGWCGRDEREPTVRGSQLADMVGLGDDGASTTRRWRRDPD